MFKHDLGLEAIANVTGLMGVITSRSENLYGCNRYYLQPKVGADMKVPDGWWVDEDDVKPIQKHIEPNGKTTGGPMSRIC